MIFCLWYFIHAKCAIRQWFIDRGLFSIISHRSKSLRIIRYVISIIGTFPIDALRSFSRRKSFVGSTGLSPFSKSVEISARSGGKLAENAWKRGYAFGRDFKRGTGRKRVVPGRRADYHAYAP